MAVPTLREIFWDLRALWRGLRRVAPYGTRGRIYAPRRPSAAAEGDAGGSPMKTKTEPKVTFRARVIRADGTIEDRGVIYRG